MRRTRPVAPSISTQSPSRSHRVTPGTDTIAGMPSSRATMAACESRPPRSTSTPVADGKIMIQPGSVCSATRIARWSSGTVRGSNTTRTGPRTIPGQHPSGPAAPSLPPCALRAGSHRASSPVRYPPPVPRRSAAAARRDCSSRPAACGSLKIVALIRHAARLEAIGGRRSTPVAIRVAPRIPRDGCAPAHADPSSSLALRRARGLRRLRGRRRRAARRADRQRAGGGPSRRRCGGRGRTGACVRAAGFRDRGRGRARCAAPVEDEEAQRMAPDSARLVRSRACARRLLACVSAESAAGCAAR